MAKMDIKIRDFTMKSKEKYRKIKKKKAEIEPGWKHILKEPYCMIRTYRGLMVGKKVK